MNILTSPLPTKIKVNDNIYDINYDYRTVINILLAFEDQELTNQEKAYIMLKNLYKEEIPVDDVEEAINKAIKFIDCGKEYTKNNSSERVYSFNKDANYIFTGINSTHHIDIDEKPNLHWWKFVDFFMDMSNECMFGELIYYRKRKIEGKLTKEEKQNYEKIKDLVDLEKVKIQSEDRKRFFEEFNKNKNKEV